MAQTVNPNRFFVVPPQNQTQNGDAASPSGPATAVQPPICVVPQGDQGRALANVEQSVFEAAKEAIKGVGFSEEGATRALQPAFQRMGFDAVSTAATGPVGPPGTPPNLTQHGGAILDAPKLANIYVGGYWNTTAGKQDAQANDAQTTDFGQSAMMDVAKQYGSGAAQFLGSTVSASSSPTRVTESDVQSIVKQALAAGNVKKDAQGIYTVVLPPGCVLDAGGGVTSKQGLGGFHGSFDDGTGKPVYYAVIAYSDTKGNGINFDGNSVDAVGITESHEWMEAVTDPDVNSPIPGRNLAWYDDSDNGEIGDLAIKQLPLSQTFEKDAGGFQQQLEWSNQDKLYELSAQGGGGGGDVTGSATPNAPFSKSAPASSTITLGKNVDLSKLAVSVDLSHTLSRGLHLTLTSPKGTSAPVPVHSGRTVQQTVDVSAAFAGEPTQGAWTLSVADSSKTDRGTLNAWSLDATA